MKSYIAFELNDGSCCAYCSGETSFEVETEPDSNDISEHPHNDKPRTYLCTVCEKRFMTKAGLKHHKVRHNEEKLYSCTQCEKHFTNQHYLQIHMNVHSSKYKCTECGKCFSSNQHLTLHGRSHSGEKPFEWENVLCYGGLYIVNYG